MRQSTSSGLLVAILVMGCSASARAEVRVSIGGGKVSITATDATVREILAEWAKVGRTKIVNGEKVAGAPVTLQLVDVPEEEALRTVLRSVSGYVAAPRAVMEPTASRFDRILVMPVSSAPASGNTPRASANPPPVFQPPQFVPVLQQPDEQQEQEVGQETIGGPPRRPVFNPFPQPPQIPNLQQLINPGGVQAPPAAPQTPQSYPQPTAPVGTAFPGMILPQPTPDQPDPNKTE